MSMTIETRHIKRLFISRESIQTGKFIFCTDTYEAFFDEDTKLRIYLGKIKTFDFEIELTNPTADDTGRFVYIINDRKLKYSGSDLIWRDITTRDEMVQALGSIDIFIPYNLIKDGKLIAPRTLTSCIVTNKGENLEDYLNGIDDLVSSWSIDGIPAEMITSGIIDYSHIPKETRLDFIPVENEEERLKLTIDKIQNNDVVQEEDTGKMFFVVDDTKLGTNEAFREFTVGSIPWHSVINRPISISLKNGVVGSVSTNTSSTTDSQKLMIDASLNVDYTANGILKKEFGGTGNQTGTAAFVEKDDKNTKMTLAGFQSSGRMQETSEVTIENGIITANKFISLDTDTPSNFYSIELERIILSNTYKDIIVKDSKGYIYNIINFDEVNNDLNIGDNDTYTNIDGDVVTINTNQQIINKINNKTKLTITDSEVTSAVPVSAKDKLIIKSSSNNSSNATFEYGNIVNSVTYNKGTLTSSSTPIGMTSTVNDSISKGLIIFSDNNCIVIKKGQKNGSIYKTADHLLEISTDTLKVNAETFLGDDVNVFGNLRVKGKLYGTATQAINSDTLDGYHAVDFMKNDGSNNTKPPVVTQASAPEGRSNCVWINTNNGVAHYWTGTQWTPISNTWKNSV